jgi:hypothetical protein
MRSAHDRAVPRLPDRAIESERRRALVSGVRSVHRQFVLPIALHKRSDRPVHDAGRRALLDRLGLLRLFGSPVTLVAERCVRS